MVGLALLPCRLAAQEQPVPGPADSPTIKVLRGLTVPEFEVEMQGFVQALGVSCNYCHVRGNFASDEKPQKVTARRMLELTKSINAQFFPNHVPAENESRLGKVTCYTCHQGNEKPRSGPGN